MDRLHKRSIQPLYNKSMKCSECPQPHHARGYCHAHYMQWHRGVLYVERIKSSCRVCGIELYTATLCRQHWLVIYKNSKPLYSLYNSLKQRCYNPNSKLYPLYGAKGVKMAQAWLDDYYTFEDDVGERPDGARLKRKNPSLGFSPSNCYWG